MPLPAIQFYHLLTTPLERALPLLLEKALAQGMRALVNGDREQIGLLDKALWTYTPDSFLPHGAQGDAHADRQPVYLTTGSENPAGAEVLVIVNGAEWPAYEGFSRVFDIFDGGDDTALAAARRRWKAYLDAGYPLTYIRQSDNGGWEKLKEA